MIICLEDALKDGICIFIGKSCDKFPICGFKREILNNHFKTRKGHWRLLEESKTLQFIVNQKRLTGGKTNG
jgi:hypothetical protein